MQQPTEAGNNLLTLSRAKTAVEAIASWSWPVKFVFGTLLSALVGGGFLGFLVEHATYAYALTFGFRPPVEGLPYLRALVTLTSVVLSLVVAYVLASIVGLVGFLFHRLQKDDEALSKLRASFTFTRVLAIGIGVGVVVTLPSAFVSHFDLLPVPQLCMWPFYPCLAKPGFNWPYLLMGAVFGAMFLLMVWRETFVWFSAGGLILGYFIWLGANILPPEGYARLLRDTGFGGGIETVLEVANSEEGEKATELRTHLLLRTAAFFVIYNRDANRIDELPASRVLRVSYPGRRAARAPICVAAIVATLTAKLIEDISRSGVGREEHTNRNHFCFRYFANFRLATTC